MRQQFNLHLSPRRTITAWNRHFISMECNAWTSQKGHIRRLDLHESVTSSSPLEACAMVGRSKYEGKSGVSLLVSLPAFVHHHPRPSSFLLKARLIARG